MSNFELYKNGSEYNTKPSSVIIHNPISYFDFKDFEGVESTIKLYENMLFRGKPDVKFFHEQYNIFKETLMNNIDNVINLDTLVPNHIKNLFVNNPNQIYTRDSIITFPWSSTQCILCNLGKSIREPERIVMQNIIENLSLTNIVDIPKELILEGGDVIPIMLDGKKVLIIGYGPRTSKNTIKFLQKNIIPNFIDYIISIELGDWRINLDGGMVPVSNNLIVSHLQSILKTHVITAEEEKEIDFVSFMMDYGFKFINVTYDESKYKQACNCFCIDNNKIVQYDLCPEVSDKIEKFGIEVLRIPGSELVLGTGGPRCMTRPLYK